MENIPQECRDYDGDVPARKVVSIGSFAMATSCIIAAMGLEYYLGLTLTAILLGSLGTIAFAAIAGITWFLFLPNVHTMHHEFHRKEEIPLCSRLSTYLTHHQR